MNYFFFYTTPFPNYIFAVDVFSDFPSPDITTQCDVTINEIVLRTDPQPTDLQACKSRMLYDLANEAVKLTRQQSPEAVKLTRQKTPETCLRKHPILLESIFRVFLF
uniref:Uncharacterized protein n=1 Tax=Cacopsylla melanoneura TaxID=428564 RepID=A0A8D9DNJ0_9HEMI